ncbi:hypothetical protein [Paraliomyxa miuraensis]|uniref:hypothetical protein n=1 Tax=Paraliomyxa miuraensis TaxID=376150 RepID=UPI00225050AC|nr:hypothetical protein [Paraliomyxa miuraensis]MCX4245021.1 hypothetical protein [Paraliomyxa miuraensis]
MAASLLIGAGACSPRYDSVDIQRVAGHADASGSEDGFVVPEGGVFVFELDPDSVAGRRDYEVTDVLELDTRQPSVARIEQGLATGTWMLLGVEQGQTDVELWINGRLELVIPVDVLAQEDSP